MTAPFNPLVVFTDADRFESFRKSRTENPISRTPFMPIWNVLGYNDCLNVLRDTEHFSSDPQYALSRMSGSKTGGGPLGFGMIFDSLPPFIREMIVTRDPPTHTRLRGIVMKAFTPRMIARLEPNIAKLSDELLDRIERGGAFDLMEEFAIPLPIYVIAEILGVDPSLRADFKRWSNKMVLDPTANAFTSPGQKPDTAWVKEFTTYFQDLFAERRSRPKDDLTSELVRLEQEGDSLSSAELLAMCAILLVAGNETTTNWIANAVMALTEHPGDLETLRREPELIPAAMEEVLRFYSPVQSLFRFSREGAAIGDIAIPPGETVLVWLQSAHRDPLVFDQPDTFDIRRQNNRHIAFGTGIHHCIGAPLSRLEMKVAMPKLVSRLSGLRRTSTGAVRFRKSIMLYGPERLDLTFESRKDVSYPKAV